jgi:hypothetical protein
MRLLVIEIGPHLSATVLHVLTRGPEAARLTHDEKKVENGKRRRPNCLAESGKGRSKPQGPRRRAGAAKTDINKRQQSTRSKTKNKRNATGSISFLKLFLLKILPYSSTRTIIILHVFLCIFDYVFLTTINSQFLTAYFLSTGHPEIFKQ